MAEFFALPKIRFFKENVRYPVWTCRDPIFSDSRNPMMIFADSRDPNRVPKTPEKKPAKI